MKMLSLKLKLAGLASIAGAVGKLVAKACAVREIEPDPVVSVVAAAVAMEEGNNDDIIASSTALSR